MLEEGLIKIFSLSSCVVQYKMALLYFIMVYLDFVGFCLSLFTYVGYCFTHYVTFVGWRGVGVGDGVEM
jgi:hypothetical protein